MTRTERAHKDAAKQSKSGGAMYVVYVHDEGTQCMDREQMAIYGSLVHIEAVYIGGVKASDSAAVVA